VPLRVILRNTATYNYASTWVKNKATVDRDLTVTQAKVSEQ
jgi:hypothetical protein